MCSSTRPCRLSSSASWRKAWIHYTESPCLICHLCPPQPPPCKRTRRFRSGAARRAEVNSHSFVSGRGRACARPLMRRANLRFSPLCIYRLFARMPIRNYFELCENEHIDNRKVLRSRFLKESLWHWWQSDLRLICGHFSFSGNVFREILGMIWNVLEVT